MISDHLCHVCACGRSGLFNKHISILVIKDIKCVFIGICKRKTSIKKMHCCDKHFFLIKYGFKGKI
ncbi:hypothetical protein BpHYR1_043342 [Brachionus plicatilis]|uniref:Uncharacterized protein n=1 Tax=Brachionus plicatilis TaxID=10195 RepID=A0A3M7QHV4_BRAPC|nr:hypothetical protein BpHYR1_043342 [Brachionus plicatilis]